MNCESQWARMITNWACLLPKHCASIGTSNGPGNISDCNTGLTLAPGSTLASVGGPKRLLAPVYSSDIALAPPLAADLFLGSGTNTGDWLWRRTKTCTETGTKADAVMALTLSLAKYWPEKDDIKSCTEANATGTNTCISTSFNDGTSTVYDIGCSTGLNARSTTLNETGSSDGTYNDSQTKFKNWYYHHCRPSMKPSAAANVRTRTNAVVGPCSWQKSADIFMCIQWIKGVCGILQEGSSEIKVEPWSLSIAEQASNSLLS